MHILRIKVQVCEKKPYILVAHFLPHNNSLKILRRAIARRCLKQVFFLVITEIGQPWTKYPATAVVLTYADSDDETMFETLQRH